MGISNFLAAAPAAGGEQSMWQTVVFLGIGLVFFYFILFRPEQKRRKALETKRSSMKKGDSVIAMGFKGKIFELRDKTVILELFDGGKIEVLRQAITEVDVPAEQVVKEQPAKA